MNLKVKLNAVLLALVTVSIGSIIFAAYNKSKAELTNSVLKENRNLAEKTASDMEKTVEREFSMLETMAKFPSITDPKIDMKDKWNEINLIIKGNPRYSGLAFYDEKGVGYNSKGKLVDNHEKDYMAGALHGRRGMMDPHMNIYDNLVANYAVPVFASEGRQIGVISAVIECTDMATSMQEIIIGKESHPMIVNRITGMVVAHSDFDIMKEEKLILDVAGEDFVNAAKDFQEGATNSIIYYDKINKMNMCHRKHGLGRYSDCTVFGLFRWNIQSVPYYDFDFGCCIGDCFFDCCICSKQCCKTSPQFAWCNPRNRYGRC